MSAGCVNVCKKVSHIKPMKMDLMGDRYLHDPVYRSEMKTLARPEHVFIFFPPQKAKASVFHCFHVVHV